MDARPWFLRQGFTDDRILNSRYEKLLEHWEDSILMSMSMPAEMPPLISGGYMPNARGGDKFEYLRLERLDKSIAEWKKARVEEYAQQMSPKGGERKNWGG